eukprot:CAMPEP_0181130230 /NCGR_PEP_ID=MMETSP1071-20121207/29750_1 /TAXON_ID=35127 /ORGANISM="Thalassiosira sp., Strain NH16" /LENGTH=162 /DNA_ID=CAMNT_0023216281 /DNA_START=88 /DNA_END=577 /DNA_ORIENTATION=-
MNQFVQRIANWMANEIFIKGLAESKTFQRFAVRTDRHVRKYKEEGFEHVNAQIDVPPGNIHQGTRGIENLPTLRGPDRSTRTEDKEEGFEHVNAQIDELHKQATRAAYSTSAGGGGSASNTASGGAGGNALRAPQKPLGGISGFFGALGRVIRRDLGIDKKT